MAQEAEGGAAAEAATASEGGQAGADGRPAGEPTPEQGEGEAGEAEAAAPAEGATDAAAEQPPAEQPGGEEPPAGEEGKEEEEAAVQVSEVRGWQAGWVAGREEEHRAGRDGAGRRLAHAADAAVQCVICSVGEGAACSRSRQRFVSLRARGRCSTTAATA